MSSQPPWHVLEVPGVRDVAKRAARRVHFRYARWADLDDLEQEAHIAIVSTPNLLETIRDLELGLLQFRLENDLVDKVRPEVKRKERQVSYDAGQELDEGAPVAPDAAISEDYNREAVELLMPAIWDEQFVYSGPQRDDAPDPDMPKGSSNKATANNLPAMIADIKMGWAKADLTLKERRALLLFYGMGDRQQDIATHEGCVQSVISDRLYTGVGKIVACLNGGLWYLLEVAA